MTSVSDQVLERARGGDGAAFAELTEPLRRELLAHCYRMLGSFADAEDVLQETLLAAWRGLDGYAGRASLRVWLYRIATNRCLNALRDGARRADGRRFRPPEVPLPEPTRHGEVLHLDPFPDGWLTGLPDTSPGPEARYETREAISLAFVTGLQALPPLQRATLVLRDVLGLRTTETADILDTTEQSVASALKRARAALAAGVSDSTDREAAPLPGSARERAVVARFVDAFERGDAAAVAELLTADGWLTMPPLPQMYQGRAAIGNFLFTVAFRRGTRRFRLLPVRANGQPAFGAYLLDPETGVGVRHGLAVITLAGDGIAAFTRFDAETMDLFGLPTELDAREHVI